MTDAHRWLPDRRSTPAYSQADRKIDAALLDVNLHGEMVYAVADALVERNVPLVFLTGYDADALPDCFANVPLCQKPAEVDVVL